MLVLARRVGQSTTIADNIRVVVIEVRGGQVKLGFDAPKDIIIDRTEIADSRKSGA